MPHNIVILMADQWRWDTLFAQGHRCQTPNFDRFAMQATHFPNAFTPYPLCCPARGAMFTGLWPHQTGLMDNVQPGSYYPHGKLAPHLPTFLERLQEAGYATSYAGKWHMGVGTAVDRGIDLVTFSDGGRLDSGTPGPQVKTHGNLRPYYATYEKGTHRDQVAIEHGMENIRDLADGDKPFCAVVSTWGPHFAHTVPQKYADMYADLPDDLMPDNYCTPFAEEKKPAMQSQPYWPCQNTRPLTQQDWRKTIQHYWAYCTWLDAQFGRVLDMLDELNLSEDTVVAFVCDHGEMLGAHGNFDKGPYFYEEIMRIPYLICDPEQREPVHAEGFVNLRDIFPTVIDLAGMADRVLTQNEQQRSGWRSDNDATFYCYDSYHGRQFKLRGIRTERYKYNWSPHDTNELYDLVIDPGERMNLIDEPAYQHIQTRLHGRLMSWMTAEGDYLLSAHYLPPVASYIDGRSADEQHDPGWPEEQREWFYRMTEREVE